MKGLDVAVESKRTAGRRECRVCERFSCNVPTSCQPPSAIKQAGGRSWPSRIRDASTGGLCLVLSRRFEPGAGLAIELPGTDGGQPYTVLARVVHVKAEGAGSWAIGCSFISPLSDEELETLVGPVVAQGREPAAVPGQVEVAGVRFRGKLPGGKVVSGRIRTLKVPGVWPLAANQKIGLRFHDHSDGPIATVRVDDCRLADGRWVLECTFVGAAPAYLLRPS